MKTEALEINLAADISKINKAILTNDIFYGLFLSAIEKRGSRDIPLAAVGLNKSTMDFSLLINPDEWVKLSSQEKYSVLKHEAMHLTMFHLITADLYPDSRRDNIATDLVINQIIGKNKLPSWGVFIEDYEEKYPKLNWVRNAGRQHYYNELGKLSEEEKCELGIDEKAEHKWTIVDGNGDKSTITESEKDAIRVQVESTIESIAEEVKKSQGNLPSEINELIGSFVKQKPRFDYARYIRSYIGNSEKYIIKGTKLRENQKFPGMPKVILKPKSKILILIDESGSVNEDDLKDFLNEIHHLRRKTDIEIRPFDTQVMDEVKYNGKGLFKRTNCGGTSFTAAVEYYNKANYDACIIFTDGYAETPPKINKRLLWVISSNGDTSSVKNHSTCIKMPKK